jgi:tetratricopeptide (TPR) repeat protein
MKSRRLLIALAALILLGAGVGGVLWWRGGAQLSVAPPRLDLEGLDDPTLAHVLEECRQEVLRDPRSAETWGKLGKLFLANGYRDEAIPCFEQAGRLEPGEARWPYFEGLAQRLNNADDALGCFRRASGLVGPSDPTSLGIRLRYAEALSNAGKLGEASPLLRDLLDREPNNPRVHLALGALAADENDLTGALAHLIRCADDPITRQRAATHLARLYQLEGDATSAARYRARARRLPRDPDGPDPFIDEYAVLMVGRRALFLRAEQLLRGEEIPKAIELLQELAAAQPDEIEVHVKLGMAWTLLGNYPQAEAVLRKALMVRPDNVQGRYFLCVALFHQAEKSGSRSGFEAAAAEARRALARKPDHAFAHLYLGLALQKLGRQAEALAELRQAVRFSPESVDPHLHLGQALLAEGKKEEGLAQLEKAVDFADEKDARPREALQKWRKK